MSAQFEHGLSIYGLSSEEAFAKIDAEISTLEERVRSLKSLRNTIPPISRVPNELLSQIFYYSCALEAHTTIFDDCIDEDGDEFYADRYDEMRLVVSWVSRHWRNIALSSPHLWDLIPAVDAEVHPDYIRHCSLWSKNFGLRLAAIFPDDSLIEDCTPYMEQFRSIEIHFPLDHEPISPELQEFWAQPAVNLHTLALSDALLEQVDMFSGHHSRIRRLHLSQCTFDWASPMLRSSIITDLLITFPVFRVPVARLATLFSSLPALSQCWLRRCIEPTSGDLHSAQAIASRILLPCLKSSWFQDDLELILELLRHLSLPPSFIRVSIFDADPTFDILAEIIQRLWQSTGTACTAIEHMQCRRDRVGGTLEVSFPSNMKRITFDFSLIRLSPGFDITLFACEKLQLQNLQTCAINHLSPAAANRLGQLQYLHSIRLLEPPVVQELVKAVEGNTATMTYDNPETKVLFPALKELTLVKMNSIGSFEGLLGVLASRKALGRGLTKLTFVKSEGLKSMDIEPFAEVVDVLKSDLA